jgi:trehalose 6-phosphate synthase
MADTKWIWRCHIDLTDANPKVWEFFRPFVELHDASVWTMPEFVPASLEMDRVVTAPPCIDPLSVKNLELALPFCQELTRQCRIGVRPIVSGEPLRSWKDPVGSDRRFRIVRTGARRPARARQLDGHRRPRGFRVWEETEQRAATAISSCSQPPPVGSRADQRVRRIANVVIEVDPQIRPHRERSAVEAPPCHRRRAGGIKLQIRDGFDGYLVDSVESADRTIELLADPVGADGPGGRAASTCATTSSDPRVWDGSSVQRPPRMIIVSHRGPFGFSLDDTGALTPTRGPGGLAATLHLLAGADVLTDATCMSAALSDGDQQAMRAPSLPDVGTDVRFVALEPDAHRLHYEVVSNEVLWFLFHGIFDLPRTPTFGRAFRDAWEAYVSVNEAFAAAVIDAAPDGDTVLVQDYPLALVPGLLAAARPDLRIAYFAHTPFCGPGGIRVLPEDVATMLCRSLAVRPSGLHTERWAHAYEASAREVLGADAELAPRSRLRSDPTLTRSPRSRPRPPCVTRPRARRAGRRPNPDLPQRPIDLTKNIRAVRRVRAVRGHPECARVVFVAMLNSSRATVAEYIAYREEVDAAAALVNEHWATPSWQPLVVDTRDDFEQTVAGFLRYDVLFVNPIKDGLNLVAKEGPLVNERNGVLCLSREAGAYDELGHAALAVQPFDIEQNVAALHAALSMGADERAQRAAALREAASARPPEVWLRDLVTHAR